MEHSEMSRYRTNYRQSDVDQLFRWMQDGECGTIVGLPGIGRTTFLHHFVNQTADVSAEIIPITIELNMLPSSDLATFYRLVLRSYYGKRLQFSATIQHTLVTQYTAHLTMQDAFAVQSALVELLQLLHSENVRTVWILNHFAQFFESAGTLEMCRTVRGLRDKFKKTLLIFVGVNKDVGYIMPNDIIEPLREVLDSNVYWLPNLCEADARHTIEYHLQTAVVPATEADVEAIWTLSGGFPTILRVIYQWRNQLTVVPAYDEWGERLLNESAIQHRCSLIWAALTQKEQFALSAWQMSAAWPHITDESGYLDEQRSLIEKGLIVDGQVFGALFSQFVMQMQGVGRGHIWLNQQTNGLYQGEQELDQLSPQEASILRFFVENPSTRHENDTIIAETWDDVANMDGVTTQALYQQIRSLRKKIEPLPGKPVYIVNQRGGYRFFPEGRPSQ